MHSHNMAYGKLRFCGATKSHKFQSNSQAPQILHISANFAKYQFCKIRQKFSQFFNVLKFFR